jgi:hypothetical protein
MGKLFEGKRAFVTREVLNRPGLRQTEFRAGQGARATLARSRRVANEVLVDSFFAWDVEGSVPIGACRYGR